MVKNRLKILASLGDRRCVCSASWDGDDCSTRLETNCADGIDNDKGEFLLISIKCAQYFTLPDTIQWIGWDGMDGMDSSHPIQPTHQPI